MLINNKFSQDDYGDRRLRFLRLSNNIEGHQIELELSDDIVDWGKNALDNWDSIPITAHRETAEAGGAYSMLRDAEKKAYKFYNKAKAILKAMLKYEGDAGELIEEYGLKGSTSRGYKKLIAAIDVWKETHDRLVSEGDARILPDAVIAKLVEHRETMAAAWHKAIDEKTEAREARRAKKELFDRDTKMLSYLFAICKLHWGNDDTRLGALGFVKKSAIWTFKNKGEEDSAPVPE